tara:strand:+ start:41 stop:418 length:378 start_codon:yes stop_codon:yes gene_type:complete
MSENKLPTLSKTWILDLDGTMLKHNGYLEESGDTLLSGVSDFYKNNINENDFVLILTSREKEHKEKTINFLKSKNIRFDEIMFAIPNGKRVIINDTKPRGMITAVSIPVERDSGLNNINIGNEND